MIQMVLILVILVVIVFIFTKTKNRKKAEEEIGVIPDADCCGAHEVCENDSLLNSDDQIIYFDDEHLDAYKDRKSEEYTDDEIDDFREVLYTLQDSEVAAWLKSLMIRIGEMPSVVREEALMIVEERRELAKNN